MPTVNLYSSHLLRFLASINKNTVLVINYYIECFGAIIFRNREIYGKVRKDQKGIYWKIAFQIILQERSIGKEQERLGKKMEK